MTTEDREIKALTDNFDQTEPAHEAGVAELFEFYASIEPIYAQATQYLEETEFITTSNSTNQG